MTSEQLEHDTIDYEANLVQFQKETDSLVEVQQNAMLEQFLREAVINELKVEVEKPEPKLGNNQKLIKITQALEEELKSTKLETKLVQEQIVSLDNIIKKKDKVLEQVTKSSMELHKVKDKFEDEIRHLKNEQSLIKKELAKAQRRGKHDKIEELRYTLNRLRLKMKEMESNIQLVTHDQSNQNLPELEGG